MVPIIWAGLAEINCQRMIVMWTNYWGFSRRQSITFAYQCWLSKPQGCWAAQRCRRQKLDFTRFHRPSPRASDKHNVTQASRRAFIPNIPILAPAHLSVLILFRRHTSFYVARCQLPTTVPRISLRNRRNQAQFKPRYDNSSHRGAPRDITTAFDHRTRYPQWRAHTLHLRRFRRPTVHTPDR